MEDHNKNTLQRYIYLHGTTREKNIGKPQSAGCVTFRNADIIEVFDALAEGSRVEILNRDYKPS